eukprot:12952429-Alexandrium_andersonii.AAC.1
MELHSVYGVHVVHGARAVPVLRTARGKCVLLALCCTVHVACALRTLASCAHGLGSWLNQPMT